jgi:hypothetical protein
MELNQSNTDYKTLPDEIIARIELATLTVGNHREHEKIQAYVDMLNADMVEAGIIGEEVILRSPLLMRARVVFNPKRGEFVSLPVSHITTEMNVRGTFAGFEQYTSQGETILMYKIGAPSNDDAMAFDTITAPVEDSVLDLTLSEEESQSKAEVEIYRNLSKLSEVEDPKFQEYLKALIETLENGEEEDASFFAELGIIATWMLRHDEIQLVTEKRQAILDILELHIDKKEKYRLLGHDFSDVEIDRKRTIDINIFEVESYIKGVELIDDYVINQKTGTLKMLETRQPAFLLAGIEKHYMPLRHLTEFTRGYINDYSCKASFDRQKNLVYLDEIDNS